MGSFHAETQEIVQLDMECLQGVDQGPTAAQPVTEWPSLVSSRLGLLELHGASMTQESD